MRCGRCENGARVLRLRLGHDGVRFSTSFPHRVRQTDCGGDSSRGYCALRVLPYTYIHRYISVFWMIRQIGFSITASTSTCKSYKFPLHNSIVNLQSSFDSMKVPVAVLPRRTTFSRFLRVLEGFANFFFSFGGSGSFGIVAVKEIFYFLFFFTSTSSHPVRSRNSLIFFFLPLNHPSFNITDFLQICASCQNFILFCAQMVIKKCSECHWVNRHRSHN